MDINNILTIIEKIEKSNISKFEYSEKDFKLNLEKNGINANTVIENTVIDNSITETNINCNEKKLKSPIVGTFYSRSSPDSEPMVKVGDTVKRGDVVCIIEAMKLFNEIQAEFDGVVKEILINDGEPVSYDQPIMIFE